MINKMIKIIFNLIIPVKKNRIVFMSYNGHYSDSPQLISEYMANNYNNLDIIWLVDEKYIKNVPPNVKTIKINTIKSYYYYSSANVIIDNVYGNKEIYLRKKDILSKIIFKVKYIIKNKKKQYIFTTWHGTPIKRIGADEINSKIIDFKCPNCTIISDSKFLMNTMKKITFNNVKTTLIGQPRNDILYQTGEKTKIYLKEKLGIPVKSKVILYAPTFRTDSTNEKNIERSGINQLNEFDVEKILLELNKKFTGDWVFVCRFHYHVLDKLDWNIVSKKYNNKVILGNKSDNMHEYLAITDLLLTDISSCIIDYAITRKPSLLYFPDIKNYTEKERGTYFDINKLPFKLTRNNNELIKQILKFDERKHKKDLDNFTNKLGLVENKNSTKDISEYILKESGIDAKNN